MAAAAPASGLPTPRAVLAFMPGEVRPAPGPSLDRLPPRLLLVVAAADLDWVVGDARARELYEQAARVLPPARRRYVLFRSDGRGLASLPADHFLPTGHERGLDTGEGPFRGFQRNRAALDRLDEGLWWLADRTLDAGFAGRTLDAAGVDRLGRPGAVLGAWPGGRPVHPPAIAADSEAVPKLRILPHGARLIDTAAFELPFDRPAPRDSGVLRR